MAEKFDVASRLVDGMPAADAVQQYVWACRQLGYQHPDLTVHPTQIRDGYGSEEGMDLAVLQSDCLALEAAERAAQNALAVQDGQRSALADAWQGASADVSRDFLRRHGEASAIAASAVRTAAEALAALRENLWRAVDAKVDAVVTIEGSAKAQRAEWLSAAATVTTGVGDRAAAAELIDHAVKPFVDNSIRTEWLTAMRTGISSVVAAYERAAAEMAAEPQPVFEVPGELGPSWSPEPGAPPAPAAAVTAPSAATVPSAWSAQPAAPVPLPPSPPPAASIPIAPAQAPPEPAMAAPPAPTSPAFPAMGGMPSMGGMGSGMPDIGSGFSGLSGLGQQLADTLGGLLGGGPDPTNPSGLDSTNPDVPELKDPLGDEKPGDEKPGDEKPGDEKPGDEKPADEPTPAADAAVPQEPEAGPETCDVPADAAPAEPAPAPTPAPPPAEPLPPVDPPPADPVNDGQTPCAIAADELPQVGDPPE